MGETLTITSQLEGYTLTDRGTYLATEGLDLDVLTEGSKDLLNFYHVIVVDHEGTNLACAEEFSDWLTHARDAEADRRVRRRGVRASSCSCRTRRADRTVSTRSPRSSPGQRRCPSAPP